jgi:DNA invertase Pin-like site-specific DNA recombinase
VLLKAVAAEHSWAVANVFVDRPMTAKKGKERRPGEAALLDVIRRGEIRKVLILGIDRVGRSLVELVTFMDVCRNADVAVYLHDQHVDTAESNGMTLFDLTSMMALHVRQSRRDAILRGQAAARSLSIKFGRPPLCTAKVEKAKNELAAGKGVRQVARLAGISRASVSRLKAATCISGQGLGSLRLEAHRVCMN